MNKIKFYFYIFLLLSIFTACNDAEESPYSKLIFTQVSTEQGIGRASAVSFVVGEKAYIGLGRKSSGAPASNDFWEFNSVNNTWTKKGNFPGKARVNAFAEVVNSQAFVGLGFDSDFGAYQEGGAQLKDLWSYNSVTDTWVQKSSFPSEYTNACIGFVSGSDIYVGLGFNGWGFGNEMWKYNTLTDSWSQLNNNKLNSRAGAVACSNGKQVFIGTGYNTTNVNDWWAYSADNDIWKKCHSLPDGGRQLAVAMSTSDRFFVATGRHFGGDITVGFLYDDVLEYDSNKDCWYRRGLLPGGGRENAISFSINGTCYIGFGENEKGILNDLWSFKAN